MTKETFFPKPSGRYGEIAWDNPSLKKNKELEKALKDANNLIELNELLDELVLQNDTEMQIFRYSVAERFLREKVYAIQEGQNPQNPVEVYRKYKDRVLQGTKEARLIKIHEAMRALAEERLRFTQNMPPRESERAHIIDLAANHLFPAYQLTSVQSERLKPYFPIGAVVLREWSVSWQNKLLSTDERYRTS